MRILHTSDWHIGRSLCGRKRYEEYNSFLIWLTETIQQNDIEVLLVAGDVFDTTAPSNRAQELYYQFLHKVSTSTCKHVVITAGNHDSPSFLVAPKELLKVLNVHVVGNGAGDLNDEVLVLYDQQHVPELIVCAVPYLRDKDIRTAEAGESINDKERHLLEGISKHYTAVGLLADNKRLELGMDIPIVGMGHLFTSGGRIVDDDGVRELYIGTLAHVSADAFPKSFNYTALGHLHIPQKVNKLDTIRYSGSPLPMGFGEAKQKKRVLIVDIDHDTTTVKQIEVPVFQPIESIQGDWEDIYNRITDLSVENTNVWLEIVYTGDEIISDLQNRLSMSIEDTPLEIIRVKNNLVIERALEQVSIEDSLDSLSEIDVFERCLSDHNIPEEQRQDMMIAYKEILLSIQESDSQAE
ncbi:MAG: exonuclease SbcCD subunit D C-terminal domain-containing protein [Candidatus Cloacimonetes bacterium]|nr:exonuclease SbcCD subunit D C-terminal domain-containing protein [Candidatus Cloacimonadota bacterium]